MPKKPVAAQLEPAQLPGPEARKPATVRTRRQTMAAAEHAQGAPLRGFQAGTHGMRQAGCQLPSLAENGLGSAVAATQEAAPRARRTRRASMAAQLRASAGTAKDVAECMASQLPADNRRGASTATLPEHASAAEVDPQPHMKPARRKTGAPSVTAAPVQDTGHISCAGAMPALCSLSTINEDKEAESSQDKKPKSSCSAVDDHAHEPSVAAAAACDTAGQKGQGGGQLDSIVPVTVDNNREVPESDRRPLLALREERGSRRQAEPNQGPLRRSARRAVSAAGMCSADGQPACPQPACSPVTEHAAATAGSPQPGKFKKCHLL